MPSDQAITGFEIINTRMIAAPVERVYQAFADPNRLASWWGPGGFTNTFTEFDLRPGGSWRFVMHGPDGRDYQNACAFVDVVPNERIVFLHLSPVHRFRMAMTFAACGDRTELIWRMTFDSHENAGFRDFITQANEQNFDRLEAHLAAS